MDLKIGRVFLKSSLRREKEDEMRISRVIGISFLILVMGCNSGLLAEEKAKNEFLGSIANLGKGFLDVFVAFGDMVSGTLGG